MISEHIVFSTAGGRLSRSTDLMFPQSKGHKASIKEALGYEDHVGGFCRLCHHHIFVCREFICRSWLKRQWRVSICNHTKVSAHPDAWRSCMILAKTYLPLVNPWVLASTRVKGYRGQIRTNKHHILRFEALKRTLDTQSLVSTVEIHCSVVESHDAGKSPSCREPGRCRNPQPAADSVVPANPLGFAVRRYADRMLLPVNLPGHWDVVWVEVFGHAHQSLRPALVVWRSQNSHFWFGDFVPIFCKDTQQRMKSFMSSDITVITKDLHTHN